jgi:hypothetical protein
LLRDLAPNLKNRTLAEFLAAIRLARLHEILRIAVEFDAPQQQHAEMRRVSNACLGEPGEVPDEEVNAQPGNPG